MSLQKLFENSPLYSSVNSEISPSDVYSVHRGVVHHYNVSPNALQFDCGVCKTSRTLTRSQETHLANSLIEHFTVELNSDYLGPYAIAISYSCQSCLNFYAYFLITLDFGKNQARKTGQFPSPRVNVERNLQKLLGQHEEEFQKGLVCESQGYGAGAYTYYRRILEKTIDKLLEDITDILQEDEKVIYAQALEKAKAEQQISKKIEFVKDALPAVLKPEGYNPLGLLYKTLSEGIHNKTDEECLELAGGVRHILVFLVSQIETFKKQSTEFVSAMKSLLDSPS